MLVMSPKPLAILAVAACLATPASALVLRVYSPASHDRFTGFPANPSHNGSFIHSGLDLTGVGYHSGSGADTRKQFTLISPKFFVSANHFRPPVGTTVRFVASDNQYVERAISALHTIPNSNGEATDLLLGELSEPVDPASGVQFLPYLNLATEGAYAGQPLVVLGKNARGGRGTISPTFIDFGDDPITGGSGINSTRAMQFTYSTLGGGNDDAHAEAGDSGSPSLVVSGGRAAIVGTHTAVLSALGTTTTVDTFVPHYVEELNAVMESDGYHMTDANPASVALGLTQELPTGTIRAGYPFTITISVENQDLTNDTNNLRVVQTLPAQAELGLVSGTKWFPETAAGKVTALRGGLGPNTISSFMVDLTLPDPGSFTSALTLSYDEGATVIEHMPFTVIESYRSWSRDLSDGTPEADPDNDNIPNLLEYAFGGNPVEASPEKSPAADYTEAGEQPRARITYRRRTDAEVRGLSYIVESGSSLADGSWANADSEIAETIVTPEDAGFEIVEVLFAASNDRRFFRLRVDLNEEGLHISD